MSQTFQTDIWFHRFVHCRLILFTVVSSVRKCKNLYALIIRLICSLVNGDVLWKMLKKFTHMLYTVQYFIHRYGENSGWYSHCLRVFQEEPRLSGLFQSFQSKPWSETPKKACHPLLWTFQQVCGHCCRWIVFGGLF